jgi:hypothetical protein
MHALLTLPSAQLRPDWRSEASKTENRSLSARAAPFASSLIGGSCSRFSVIANASKNAFPSMLHHDLYHKSPRWNEHWPAGSDRRSPLMSAEMPELRGDPAPS